MKKLDKVKNVRADNAFKEVGVVQPLSEKDYEKIIDIYKGLKEFDKPVKFDDKTDLIIAKIPERLEPREMPNETKDGKKQFSVSVIMMDEKWYSLIIPEAEKNDYESFQGCKVAIVGKIVANEKDGKTYMNIKRYRGSAILEGKDKVDDVDI